MYPMRPVQPPRLLAARPYDDSSRPIRGIRKVPEIAWEITLRRLSAPVRRPDDGTGGKRLIFSWLQERACNLCAPVRTQSTGQRHAIRLCRTSLSYVAT